MVGNFLYELFQKMLNVSSEHSFKSVGDFAKSVMQAPEINLMPVLVCEILK